MGNIVVFGKPPLPGVSKTRLGAQIGHESAAKVAKALLIDSVERYRSFDVQVVVATTDVTAEHGVSCELWDQGTGDLGERLEQMARRSLEMGDWVLLVGADAPHVPEEALIGALGALRSGRPALGLSEDGGFWGLGLQQCPVGLLADLPWSHVTTGARTLERLHRWGQVPHPLPVWWDVDTSADLVRMKHFADVAPRTAALAC